MGLAVLIGVSAACWKRNARKEQRVAQAAQRRHTRFTFEQKFILLQEMGLISAEAPKVLPNEIPREAVKMHTNGLLGKGAFGEVWRGTLVPSSPSQPAYDVAIKTCTDPAAEAELVAECVLLASVGKHENVVQCLGCVSIGSPTLLVLALSHEGALQSFLKKRASGPQADVLLNRQKLTFTLDVANGMQHLVEHGILHRDLAARTYFSRRTTAPPHYHRTVGSPILPARGPVGEPARVGTLLDRGMLCCTPRPRS